MVLHVTVWALYLVVAAVNVWDRSSDPCHVLVSVQTTVPTGGHINWAGIVLERGEQEVLVVIE